MSIAHTNPHLPERAPEGYVWRTCGHKTAKANCRGCGDFYNPNKSFDEKFKTEDKSEPGRSKFRLIANCFLCAALIIIIAIVLVK